MTQSCIPRIAFALGKTFYSLTGCLKKKEKERVLSLRTHVMLKELYLALTRPLKITIHEFMNWVLFLAQPIILYMFTFLGLDFLTILQRFHFKPSRSSCQRVV